jgi:NTE family protein
MKHTPTAIPSNIQHRVYDLLQDVFGKATEAQTKALISRLAWVQLNSGEHLFSQGEDGDALFVLVQGRMKVLRHNNGHALPLREIVPGEVIGELALISEQPRSADVIAVRDSGLLVMSRSDFKSLYSTYPDLAWKMSQTMAYRLTVPESRRNLRRIKNLALVTLSGGNEIDKLIDELLIHSLSEKVIVLSDDVSKEQYYHIDHSNMSRSELLALTDKMEGDYDLVIYRCNSEDSKWNAYSLRQADEVVLVAQSDQGMQVPILDRFFDNKGVLTLMSMVILHPTESLEPAAVRRLLAGYHCDYHFHIRDWDRDDIARLWRHLFDRSIGLVLAGGGARALAHVGVWKAITELGIPIDRIGSSGSGSAFGGVLALGCDLETTLKICRDLAANGPSKNRSSIPGMGLFKGNSVGKTLKKYFGDRWIEDCPIPFYCISTNLTSGMPTKHVTGDMYKAIAASTALPGLVPPVRIGEDYHVDGLITDNFPIENMIEWGAKKIIGVNFDRSFSAYVSEGGSPTSQPVLEGLFGGRKKNELTLLETMIFSVTAGKQNAKDDALIDALIKPEVGRYGVLEWSAYDDLVQAGYSAAMLGLRNFDY